eukprot:c13804_g1_i1.p1 GENE.c13804_g1_i1~~c13804_g1_i1.p1  ORF type:complete len:562 (-),score=114.79 c13804_g1_i1:43-1728(-)
MLVLVVLCVVGLTAGQPPAENPLTTHASINLAQATVDEPDVGSTDALTDEGLVANKFANKPVNLETLKEFVKQRGASDVGLISDLTSRVACIIRLEADAGVEPLSPDTLRAYLTARELSVETASNEGMLDKACDYQRMESAVRNHLDRPMADISKTDIKKALKDLGFVSTAGSKSELVYRLGKAVLDLKQVRKLTGDHTFDTSDLGDYLQARGLDTQGQTHELLSRLSGYLVSIASSAGIVGISSQCDLVLAGSICIEGGSTVVSASAAPRGLVGHWTFDDATGQDTSGKANHATTPPKVGQGVNGAGASAHFDGSDHLEIPHSDHLATSDFCVTMWLYLLADSTGDWRTIIHKGNQDHERTPTLFLEPATRGLEFFVSTTDAKQPAGERLWSNTFVPLHKWTHIAACAEGRNMRLFINGLLDAENTTIGNIVTNEGPMYVGHDPWRPGTGTASFVDELRFYNHVLHTDEIQAQAQLALGGVEASLVELGCMGCSVDSCPKACRRGYRMCTQRDVVSGAYTVSRSMGWSNSETRVWVAEDTVSAADTPAATGLCMCCREEE